MSTTFDQSPGIYLSGIFVGVMVILFAIKLLFGQPRRDYTPLPGYKRPQTASAAAWYLRPLYSRGSFSPRLLMAWQAFYFTCFLAWKVVEALTNPIGASASLTQNASLIVQLLFGFIGLVVSLLGMGTFQKVKLGDIAPSMGEIDAEATKPEPTSTAQPQP